MNPEGEIEVVGGQFSKAARVQVRIWELRQAAARWRLLAEELERANDLLRARWHAASEELLASVADSPGTAGSAYLKLTSMLPAGQRWAAHARRHSARLAAGADAYSTAEEEARARIDDVDRFFAPVVLLGGGMVFALAAQQRGLRGVHFEGLRPRFDPHLGQLALGDAAGPIQHLVNALPGTWGASRVHDLQPGQIPDKRRRGHPSLEATTAVIAGTYARVLVRPGVTRPLPTPPSTSLADLLRAVPEHPGAKQDSVDVHHRLIRGSDGVERAGYVVVLRGTSVWNFPGGDTGGRVRSMGPNLEGVAAIDSPEVEALPEVLRAAGVPSGAGVALVGHSQGGLTAMRAATSPGMSRYRVTHVITAGSPVSRLEPSTGAKTLSLEHRRDLVPRLDGADNTGRQRHITVRTQGPVGSVQAAHASESYAATAARLDSRVAEAEAGRSFEDADRSLADYSSSLREAGHLIGKSDTLLAESSVRVPLVPTPR